MSENEKAGTVDSDRCPTCRNTYRDFPLEREIAALRAEVATLAVELRAAKAHGTEMFGKACDQMERADKTEAEVERLTKDKAILDAYFNEARVERLTAALREILDRKLSKHDMDIARAALEEGK